MFYSQPCTVAVHFFTLQAGYIMSCQDLCLWLRDSSSDSMVTVNSSAECNRREKYLQSKSYLLSRGGKERLFSELLWKIMRLTVKSVFFLYRSGFLFIFSIPFVSVSPFQHPSSPAFPFPFPLPHPHSPPIFLSDVQRRLCPHSAVPLVFSLPTPFIDSQVARMISPPLPINVILALINHSINLSLICDLQN